MKYLKKIEFGIIFIIFLIYLQTRKEIINTNRQIIIEKIETLILKRDLETNDYFLNIFINIISIFSCCWGIIFCIFTTSVCRRIYIIYNIIHNYNFYLEYFDIKTIILFVSFFIYFMKKNIWIFMIMIYMNIFELKRIADLNIKGAIGCRSDKKK